MRMKLYLTHKTSLNAHKSMRGTKNIYRGGQVAKNFACPLLVGGGLVVDIAAMGFSLDDSRLCRNRGGYEDGG
ncbi:hypothetical protein Ef18B233LT_44780 (plasmid) [Escherichia fergusonii]|nr:hypothetical protein Ef18B006LT_44570 [Escherichia fergusonii]BES20648.1 hypothetical protein Ef18B233LT_44780 [Escherichia fergusonii]BES48264.1 hypothetical protein Ef22C057LT_47410 [Escherichia fergusonii]